MKNQAIGFQLPVSKFSHGQRCRSIADCQIAFLDKT